MDQMKKENKKSIREIKHKSVFKNKNKNYPNQ